ncbi:uncharacterized protein TrAtP1_005637 [Trichoderma atroviride]|uniref:uncharacterized protein n=1 Tax=Hypocrea atroviridis TaxID=63577 RepID=UPI00331C1A58|nr:hypothetical protein TrAtP1_005637 [Trichoderma atroviride]
MPPSDGQSCGLDWHHNLPLDMCIIVRPNASLQPADHPTLVQICTGRYMGYRPEYCARPTPIPHTQTRFQHQTASSSRKEQLMQICSNASTSCNSNLSWDTVP